MLSFNATFKRQNLKMFQTSKTVIFLRLIFQKKNLKNKENRLLRTDLSKKKPNLMEILIPRLNKPCLRDLWEKYQLKTKKRKNWMNLQTYGRLLCRLAIASRSSEIFPANQHRKSRHLSHLMEAKVLIHRLRLIRKFSTRLLPKRLMN